MSVIPEFGEAEDCHKCEASLGYILRSYLKNKRRRRRREREKRKGKKEALEKKEGRAGGCNGLAL